ncbi:YcxB family protein [Colwelliaceae bacterium 6441]
MTTAYSYTTTFILDKSYFTECFEQSSKVESFGQAYFKAIFFSVFGALLVLFTPINAYVAWFLFALGIVEALGVYYKKPWWVTRQMLGKSSKSEVTLLISEEGVRSHSFYIDEMIHWQDVSLLEQTDKGWVFVHSKGKSYISSSFLNEECLEFLKHKKTTLSSSETENNNE